jgi:LPS export ABC transporter protein LptC
MKIPCSKYGANPLVRSGILMALVFGSLVACKNDIETIKALTNEIDLPDFTGYDIDLTYTDSGILKGRIIAPEVNQYLRKEEPYYEFPKGMKTIIYDLSGREKAYIQANYAIYYNNKQLWEARNQVLAENPSEGKKLETEQMFWDQNEKKIYSDKFTRMTNPDGVFTGDNGFESDESLTDWGLRGMSGWVNIDKMQTTGQ